MPIVGIATAQGVGDVQGRFDVPGRAAAGKHDVHASASTAARRVVGPGPARARPPARAKAMSTPSATRVGSSDDPP